MPPSGYKTRARRISTKNEIASGYTKTRTIECVVRITERSRIVCMIKFHKNRRARGSIPRTLYRALIYYFLENESVGTRLVNMQILSPKPYLCQSHAGFRLSDGAKECKKCQCVLILFLSLLRFFPLYLYQKSVNFTTDPFVVVSISVSENICCTELMTFLALNEKVENA